MVMAHYVDNDRLYYVLFEFESIKFTPETSSKHVVVFNFKIVLQ